MLPSPRTAFSDRPAVKAASLSDSRRSHGVLLMILGQQPRGPHMLPVSCETVEARCAMIDEVLS